MSCNCIQVCSGDAMSSVFMDKKTDQSSSLCCIGYCWCVGASCLLLLLHDFEQKLIYSKDSSIHNEGAGDCCCHAVEEDTSALLLPAGFGAVYPAYKLQFDLIKWTVVSTKEASDGEERCQVG